MCDDGATAGRSPWSSSGRARVDSDGQDDGNASSHPRAPLNLPKTPRKMGRKPPVKVRGFRIVLVLRKGFVVYDVPARSLALYFRSRVCVACHV